MKNIFEIPTPPAARVVRLERGDVTGRRSRPFHPLRVAPVLPGAADRPRGRGAMRLLEVGERRRADVVRRRDRLHRELAGQWRDNRALQPRPGARHRHGHAAAAAPEEVGAACSS